MPHSGWPIPFEHWFGHFPNWPGPLTWGLTSIFWELLGPLDGWLELLKIIWAVWKLAWASCALNCALWKLSWTSCKLIGAVWGWLRQFEGWLGHLFLRPDLGFVRVDLRILNIAMSTLTVDLSIVKSDFGFLNIDLPFWGLSWGSWRFTCTPWQLTDWDV